MKTENDHINLKVAGQDGSVVQFKIKRHTPLSKLMKAYCERQVRAAAPAGRGPGPRRTRSRGGPARSWRGAGAGLGGVQWMRSAPSLPGAPTALKIPRDIQKSPMISKSPP